MKFWLFFDVGEFSFVVEDHAAAEGFVGFAPDFEGGVGVFGDGLGEFFVQGRLGGDAGGELDTDQPLFLAGIEPEIGGDERDQVRVVVEAFLDFFGIDGFASHGDRLAAAFDGDEGEFAGRQGGIFGGISEVFGDEFGVGDKAMVAGPVAKQGDGAGGIQDGEASSSPSRTSTKIRWGS